MAHRIVNCIYFGRPGYCEHPYLRRRYRWGLVWTLSNLARLIFGPAPVCVEMGRCSCGFRVEHDPPAPPWGVSAGRRPGHRVEG